MKRTISLLLAIFCLGVSWGQETPWTLEACVERALEKNISIKQAELNYADTQLGKKAAIGNFLPSFNISSSHSWNIGLNQNITTGLLENLTTQFTSVGLNVGLDIYNGLQNINRLHRANLALLANQYQLSDMAEDVSLLVANSYLQVLFNRESLTSQQLQLEISKEQLSRSQELVNSGVIPAGDLFELEANLAAQEQRTILAENSLRLTKISLAQLLLITDYENFEIANENYELPLSNILLQSPKDIFNKSLSLRNDIKLAETNVLIAEKDLQIAKGAFQPRLSAFYGYSSRISYSDRLEGIGKYDILPTALFVEGSLNEVLRFSEITRVIGPASFEDQFNNNAGQNFGLQLSIPILNGFSVRNNVARNKINVERSKYTFEQHKLNLENTINQAYNDVQGAFKAFDAAQKTLQARERAFSYTSERFDLGVVNSFEYSQAKQRFELAQSEVIRTKYDYIFKLKVLEFYFGIPIKID